VALEFEGWDDSNAMSTRQLDPDEDEHKLDGVTERTPALTALNGAAMGRVYEIGEGYLVIGRDADCDIILDDDSVSRRHAEVIAHAGGVVMLRDLSSTNGTFVNGLKISEINLGEGDTVRIGADLRLRFSLQDRVQASLQKQLYDAATRDGLMGIYNRRYFTSRLDEEFAFCSRHQRPLSLILIDIDHFKDTNDTWGHPAGDAVLAQLPRLIRSAIRREDVLCRFGGDELAIILREVPLQQAMQCAERIRLSVERAAIPIETAEGEPASVKITVSVGVAALDFELHFTATSMIRDADRRLYAAKSSGRNRIKGSD
jgi:two-component system cell cycle response regulator